MLESSLFPVVNSRVLAKHWFFPRLEKHASFQWTSQLSSGPSVPGILFSSKLSPPSSLDAALMGPFDAEGDGEGFDAALSSEPPAATL